MAMAARMGTITGSTVSTGTAMNTNPLHVFAQWFSPAFPVGAFAWSHGLEWAISQGEIRDKATLESWLEVLLREGAGRNDAIFLKLAYEARDPAPVAELARAFAFGGERLAETEAQGRAFVETVNALYGWDMVSMPLPVALGQAARRKHLPIDATLRYFLHAFSANLISAAVRFMPMGQGDGQAVLTALFAVMDDVAQAARRADEAALGGSAIRADLAALQHETLTTRIYRS